MNRVVHLFLCIAVALIAGCPSKTVRYTEAPDGELLYNRKPLRQWLHALEDADPKVRSDALDVVETIADPQELGAQTEAVVSALSRVLSDNEVAFRKRAAETLGRIGPDAKTAVPALVTALEDGEVGLSAIEALTRIGPGAQAATRPLLKLLKHKDERVRGAATRALGDVGAKPEEVVPALIEALKHEADRWSAARTLGRYGPWAKAAIPELLALLKSENEDPLLQGTAAFALGAMGPEAKVAIPALIKLTKRQEGFAQQHTALALVRLGETEVGIAALREQLGRDSLFTELELYGFLGYIGPESKAAVPVLTDALKDPSPNVRRFAAAMLGRIDAQVAAQAGYAAVEVMARLVPYGAGRPSHNRSFRAVALAPPWVYGLDRTGSLSVFRISDEDKGKKQIASKVLDDVGDGNDLKVFGDVLLCTRSGSLEAYSLRQPGEPQHLGRFGPEQPYHSQTIIRHGNAAFLIGWNGILSYEVSEPSKPRFLARTECQGQPWAGCVAGNHLYVGGSRLREGVRYGIAIYEITGPGALKEVGFAATSRLPYHLFALPGNQLLAGSALFSLTRPVEPTLVGEFSGAGGRASAILVRGEQAYVVSEGGVFSVGPQSLKRYFEYGLDGSTLDGLPYHGDSSGAYVALPSDRMIAVLRLRER